MKTGETIDFTTAPENLVLAPTFIEPNHNVGVEASYTEFPDLGNKELPFYKQKQEFAEALDKHQVVIVLAPTGNGKSTQAPQIALEREFEKVIITQPRRDPARNVAERITSEIAGVLGEDRASQLVSYQTGGGLVGSKNSRIKVVTEELLLTKDAFQPASGDGEVWMLDEWHEKSNVQFILGGVAKEKLAKNPNFRVVIMSATVDKQKLND
jgi:HrpA-like RNA helicase